MGKVSSIKWHAELFGLKGVFCRALWQVGGKELFRVPVAKGRSVLLRLGTKDIHTYEHVFRFCEYDIALDKEPRIIIDAGAHIGLAAVYFALRFPHATIIALEPNLANFDLLTRNTVAFRNVVPVQAALWDRDGKVDVRDPGVGTWGYRVRVGSEVDALSMPSLMKMYQMEKVDLLKLDVEGAEVEILGSSNEWIDRVDVIWAELHDRFRDGCTWSFDKATASFPSHWTKGELSCASRAYTALSKNN